jgi:hypothetical protein
VENINEEVQDVQSDVEVQSDDGFAEGFAEARGEEPPVQAEVPETAQPTEQASQAVEPEPEPEPQPLIAGLTESQVKELLVKAGQVDELNARIEKVFGKFGEVQRNLQTLQSQKSSGVRLNPESFKRMREEFPEMVDLLTADLSEALEGASGQASIDPTAIESIVSERLSAKEREIEEAMERRWLKRQHKDWEDVIRSDDFMLWGQNELQPEEWQSLLASRDSEYISDGLTRFKEWRDRAVKAKESKQKRLEAAITPKGGVVPGTSVQSEEEAFAKAFNDVMKQRLY